MPDALPAAALPISGLGHLLSICWLAYSEARLINNKTIAVKMTVK